MRPSRPFVALVLSLAYGLIAVAGHGLHALAPCGDPDCQQSVEVCQCGCHHAADQAEGADQGEGESAALSIRGVNRGAHHPHNCPFCVLLAKVKVGHSSLLANAPSLDAVAAGAVSKPIVAIGDKLSAYSPRGPPLTSA